MQTGQMPSPLKKVFGLVEGLRQVFKTSKPIVIFPASGTGAWEAALVNTLAPGDRVLMFETGHFSTLWKTMAEKLGFNVNTINLWKSYGHNLCKEFLDDSRVVKDSWINNDWIKKHIDNIYQTTYLI